MLRRRDFLKGMLATLTTGVLTAGGIVKAEHRVIEPERSIFDMAANTWRQDTYHVRFTESEDVWRYKWPSINLPPIAPPLRPLWSMEWNITLTGEFGTPLTSPWVYSLYDGAPITFRHDGYEIKGRVKEMSGSGAGQWFSVVADLDPT